MANNINFRQIAQDTTQLCRLMSGRTKMDTDEVVEAGVLTITAFDFAPKFDKEGHPLADPSTGEQDVFGVVTFAEHPDRYYSVGTVFTKVCKAWAEQFGGSAEAASVELTKSGGVQVRFSEGKTKAGNNLINVEIV